MKENFDNRVFDVCVTHQMWKNPFTGGMADQYFPWDFDMVQLRKGAIVEMEHTNDVMVAIKIAMDHLVEARDYYIELEKMEAKLKEAE